MHIRVAPKTDGRSLLGEIISNIPVLPAEGCLQEIAVEAIRIITERGSCNRNEHRDGRCHIGE